MSMETERRLENLLGSSAGTVSVDNSASASTQGSKQTSRGADITKPSSVLEIDTAKERLSVQLKERQEKMKVLIICSSSGMFSFYFSNLLWNPWGPFGCPSS